MMLSFEEIKGNCMPFLKKDKFNTNVTVDKMLINQ